MISKHQINFGLIIHWGIQVKYKSLWLDNTNLLWSVHFAKEYLKLLKDKIVIIDEVHKICHKNTEIFRTIYEYLKEKAKRIILLTGTIYSTSDKFLLGYYSLAFNKNNEYMLYIFLFKIIV